MTEQYLQGYNTAIDDYSDDSHTFNIGSENDEYRLGYIDGWTDSLILDKMIEESTPTVVLDNIKNRLGNK